MLPCDAQETSNFELQQVSACSKTNLGCLKCKEWKGELYGQVGTEIGQSEGLQQLSPFATKTEHSRIAITMGRHACQEVLDLFTTKTTQSVQNWPPVHSFANTVDLRL